MNTQTRARDDRKRVGSRAIAVATLICTALITLVGNAGITRTGISSGRITAFGSIWVNGRELGTSNAQVTINGSAATEGDLRLGHVVLVNGVHDDELAIGEAAAVVVEDFVQGPISSVDAEAGRISVLGQIVRLDELTVFDLQSEADSAEDLSIGEQVEVHGYVRSDGSIEATRVQDRSNVSQFEVTGTVSGLGSETFALNGLLVAYGPAAIDPESGFELSNDAFVEVRGSSFDGEGRLVADALRSIGGPEAVAGERGEIEGFVTASGAGEYRIASVAFGVDSATAFIGGGPANLGLDARVEVRGTFDDSGRLQAEAVEFHGSKIRIEGDISASSEDGLSVLGFDIAADGSTIYKDKGPLRLQSMTMADLYVGDRVDVRSGFVLDNPEPLMAAEIRREKAGDDVLLQAFVTGYGADYIRVGGVDVRWTGKTSFRDRNGMRIGQQKFLAVLTEGSLVKVQGVLNAAGQIVANQIGYELD